MQDNGKISAELAKLSLKQNLRNIVLFRIRRISATLIVFCRWKKKQRFDVPLWKQFQVHPPTDSKWMTAVEILSRLNYYNPSVRLSIRAIALALRKQGIEIRVLHGIKRYLVFIE